MRRRVLIVGGGASGLMAAIAAAEQGAKVTVLEKNRRTGKKLLATGNGRCNFTNRDQKITHYRSRDTEFVQEALRAFPMSRTVDFFEKLGIIVKERYGCLYPNSAQASSVAEALRLEALRLQVKLVCSTEVLSVEKKESLFLIRTEGWIYEADAVILCCGSMAAPDTGSTGDGYRFAAEFGHHIIPPRPALTGVCASEKDCEKLSGVRMDAEVQLCIDGGEEYRQEGEVQFASYGLSGIPVFQLSRYVSSALSEKRECVMYLDLWPTHTEELIVRLLQAKRERTGNRAGSDVLLGVFPEKLSRALLLRAGIPQGKKGLDWTDAEYERLAAEIKHMGFHIIGCRGYEHAQACAGGVPLGELKGNTMESGYVPGLYFAGELLDVDGECGGYNLQWAWSSGYLAGVSAAGGTWEENR